jgi:hypothetical protein
MNGIATHALNGQKRATLVFLNGLNLLNNLNILNFYGCQPPPRAR